MGLMKTFFVERIGPERRIALEMFRQCFPGIWLYVIFSYNFDIYDSFHSNEAYCSLISENKYLFDFKEEIMCSMLELPISDF